MPNPDFRHIRAGATRLTLMAAVLAVLSGCFGGQGGLSAVTKMGFGAGRSPADPETPALAAQGVVQSDLIRDLQNRQTILAPGSSYAQIADAVIDDGAGVAAAELRIARLRAEAKSKNWLPSVGPSLSLSSLGAVAASLLVEQTLFDNGRRKAERAYAAADVEVAAVTLSAEINKRVYEGLKFQLTAAKAHEQAAVTRQATAKLADFERIMAIRVRGGLSDRSEQQVLQQKLAEMQAIYSSDQQAEANALAEFAAMTRRNVTPLATLQPLPADQPAPEPLAVLRSRAEGARSVAEARVAKAGLLPGIGAQASIGEGGMDTGLVLKPGNLGFGSTAARAALDATGDLAGRRTAQTAQDSNRRIIALNQEMQTLLSREAQGDEVLRQTSGNLEMFTQQYKVGRRSLLELVQQYESFARTQRDQVALKYMAADLRLQIAQERGVLVDGARM